MIKTDLRTNPSPSPSPVKQVCVKQVCPVDPAVMHTPAPEGYVAWHEWADKKVNTHYPVQCTACGLFALWIKKPIRKPTKPTPREAT